MASHPHGYISPQRSSPSSASIYDDDGPPPKSRSKSKSSSSHKHTLKSRPISKSKSPPKSSSISSSSTSAPRHYGDVKLKMPLALSDKINYNAAVAKKMEKIFQLHDKLEPFTPTFHLTNLFYLYLFKKYKVECHLPNQTEKSFLHFFLDISDRSKSDFQSDFLELQMYNIEKTANYISECIISGIKILIIPLTIKTSHGAHANILIYRANTGVIEHFEPHGKEYGGIGSAYVIRVLNDYLEKFVNLINKDIKSSNKTLNEGQEKIPKIRLLKAHDVCPVIYGVQTLEGNSMIPKNAFIEPGGYCETWSMFFTELCLKNPEMSSREVYEAIMEKTELYENKNNYLRNIIRGYTAFINNKIEKYFSRIFDEPMSSAKIHRIVQKIKTGELTSEYTQYMDKLLEIMVVERGENFFTRNPQPDVRERYIEFTQRIRPETSSSSLKSENRLSPKRKTVKKYSPHSPSTPPTTV